MIKRTQSKQVKLARRRVLRGMVAGMAATVPLPLFDFLLDGNGTAMAQGDELPTRYATWFFGNGILPGLWVPTTADSDFELPSQLQPISNFRDQLTVVTGLENKIPGDAFHPDGSAASTTGAQTRNNSAQLPSIDQIIAEQISGASNFRSIELGVTPATPNGAQNTLHTCSHRGVNAPNAPEFSPDRLFNNIFSNVETGPVEDDAQLETLKALDRSILDAVKQDAAELEARLGQRDKIRLEQHLDGIRELEQQLTGGGPVSSCTPPAAPTVGRDERSEAPANVNEVMASLSTLAFACNLTRVQTFMFSLPAAHVYFRHLGADMDDDFHDTICHTDPGTDSDQPRVHRGVIYTMECLAVYLEKMRALPEGDGTLLDRSLIYSTSCTSWGQVHSKTDWPVLLIGGLMPGNRHLRYERQNLSDVLLTLANGFGAEMTELGIAEGRTTTELAGLWG